jgi:hypothetical protein
MDVKVSSRQSEKCGFSQYIKPTIGEIVLAAQEQRYFYVYIDIPEGISPRPGLHECGVMAAEIPPEGEPGIAAYSGVFTQIWIRVPYPQKYIEARLSASNVNISEPVKFYIQLTSRGLENVTASGFITVKDLTGKDVAAIYAGSVFVESLGSATLEAEWDTSGASPGRYFATATVEYGADRPVLSEDEFKIGDMLIKITNVTHPEAVPPGEIAKIELELDSYWNDRLDDVYVSLDAMKGGVSAGGSRRSESFDIEAWASKKVPVFWETENLEEGVYDVKLTVHYSGRTTETSVEIEIRQPLDVYLLILALVLAAAIIALSAYLYRRKKRRRE